LNLLKIPTGKQNIDSSKLFQTASTTDLIGQSLKLFEIVQRDLG